MILVKIWVVLSFALAFYIFWLAFRNRAKDVAPSQAARLQRIQNASWWVQLLMIIIGLFSCYSLVAFFMGWPWLSEPKVRIVISQHHIYTAPADMPDNIFYLWLVQIAWAVFGYGVVFSLFGLYRRGILFAAQNVRRIRSLGYFLMVNWGINYQMQAALRDVQLSTNALFIGLLIIFISWIMDEGRKIQEEQELTV